RAAQAIGWVSRKAQPAVSYRLGEAMRTGREGHMRRRAFITLLGGAAGALHTHNNTQLRGRESPCTTRAKLLAVARCKWPAPSPDWPRAAHAARERKHSRRCSHASSGLRRNSTKSSPRTDR